MLLLFRSHYIHWQDDIFSILVMLKDQILHQARGQMRNCLLQDEDPVKGTAPKLQRTLYDQLPGLVLKACKQQ